MLQTQVNSDLGANHFMETGATISPSGELSAVTRTRTATLFGGFTGGVRVVFSDEQGVTIGASQEMRYGVSGRWIGQSDRTDTWSQQIDPALAQRVRQLTVVHYWAPKLDVQNYIRVAIIVGEFIVELINQLNGEPATNAV